MWYIYIGKIFISAPLPLFPGGFDFPKCQTVIRVGSLSQKIYINAVKFLLGAAELQLNQTKISIWSIRPM